MSEATETPAPESSGASGTQPALVVVDAHATAEEVAALVAVLSGLAAAAAAAAGSPDVPPPVWAAPSRAVRRTPGSAGGAGVWPGRGAWRSSALPL